MPTPHCASVLWKVRVFIQRLMGLGVVLISSSLCAEPHNGNVGLTQLAPPPTAAVPADAEALFQMGIRYANGQGVELDPVQAADWYQRAAEQGHLWAQYNLASMYYLGTGIPQDYARALPWFRLAAQHGHAWAQYDLASMYEFGHGVLPDTVLAYAFYNLAAAKEQMAKQSRDRLGQTLSREQRAEAQALSSRWVQGTPLPTQRATEAP